MEFLQQALGILLLTSLVLLLMAVGWGIGALYSRGQARRRTRHWH